MVLLIWFSIVPLYNSVPFFDEIMRNFSCMFSPAFFKFIVMPIITGALATLFLDGWRSFQHVKHIEDCKIRLHKAFHTVRCPHTGLQVVPRYKPLATLQAELCLDEKDIIEAVNASVDMRLSNLATTYSVSDNQQDKLVVECFPCEGKQRKYGYCINRGSNITIISPSSCREVGTGHFAYILARFGEFNYISKEYSQAMEEPDSFYGNVINQLSCTPKLREPFNDFMSDIKLLCNNGNHWAIYVLGTTREDENQIHFIHSCKSTNSSLICREEMEGYSVLSLMWKSCRSRLALEKEIKKQTKGKGCTIEIKDDTSIFLVSKDDAPAYLGGGQTHNALVIRVPFDISARDNRHIAVAQCIAQQLAECILNRSLKEYNSSIDFENRKKYLSFEKCYQLKNSFDNTTSNDKQYPKDDDFFFAALFAAFFLTMTYFYVISNILSGSFLFAILFGLSSLSVLGFSIVSGIVVAKAFNFRRNQLFLFCRSESIEQTLREYGKQLQPLPLSLLRFMPCPYMMIFITTLLCTLVFPALSYSSICSRVLACPFLFLSLIAIIFSLAYLAYKYRKYNNLFKSHQNETNN